MARAAPQPARRAGRGEGAALTRDYFATLDLPHDTDDEATIRRQFHQRRAALLARLNDPRTHEDARRELDELYLAYRVLADPDARARHRAERRGQEARLDAFRRRIAASLEGGLVRCSRRRQLLAEGRELGLSEFHVHLLIAEVQFGARPLLAPGGSLRSQAERAGRAGARVAAVGVLALAMFLSMIRWLGA